VTTGRIPQVMDRTPDAAQQTHFPVSIYKPELNDYGICLRCRAEGAQTYSLYFKPLTTKEIK